ncbi:MAG: ACP S-malonyltransferase [Pseudomonadota bacterium]
MARAFVFPGQGSQAIGMGRALCDAFPAAREVFEEVDDALERRLSRIMWDGPVETLTATENAQPAIMAVSVAAVRVLQKETGLDVADAMFAAGHSLGEYSALCAAGAVDLAQTARLLRVRGEAMRDASAKEDGTMAALLGVDRDGAEAIVEAALGEGALVVANDNAPGQIVISGARARVEFAASIAKEHGAKAAKMLDVAGAFHSPLMGPAAQAMADALEGETVRVPIVPVVQNVTAAPTSDPETIRPGLVDQVVGSVRWTESVEMMVNAGATRFVELGAGKVLSGLIRRIDRDVETLQVGQPADVDAFVAAV